MCGISCFTSLINIIKVTVNAFQSCWFLSLHFWLNVSLGLLSSVSFKNNLNLNFISRSREKALSFQSCYKVEFLLRWRNRKVGDLVNILTLIPFGVIMGNSSGKHTTEPDTVVAGYQTPARYKSLYPCSKPREIDFAVIEKCILQPLIVHLLCARSTVKTRHFSVFAF